MKNLTTYTVTESAKRFTAKNVSYVQLSFLKNCTIEKTEIAKQGFNKVVALETFEVKNDRFEANRVGEKFYTETEFDTITRWVFE